MRSPLRSVLVPAVLAGTLALTACGSGEPDPAASSAGTSAPAGSAAAAGASACPPGATPAATPGGTTAPVSGDAGVQVSGTFGQKPSLTIPAGAPPAELHATVLSQGDGPVVRRCDLLVANYLGQTWAPLQGKPNVFDNSYDRKQPAGFEIGVGKVVPGWDKTLVGQHVGSRVLLTLPPADGYADQSPSAQIPAKSTLVFVVDIVKAIDLSAKPGSAPVPGVPPTVPTVRGGGDANAPTITVPKGAKAPTKARTTVIATGTGDPVGDATSVVADAVQVNWTDGKVVGNTYASGSPLTLTLQQAASVPGLLAALKGANAGAQIVAELPDKIAGGTAGVLWLRVVASY